MGEIGRDRHEFLYELYYWEIVLIVQGYFRRYRQGWEQARLIAHQVHYCMGVPKGEMVKTTTEFLPFPWENQYTASMSLPNEDEVAEMQELMRNINADALRSKPAT